METKYIARKLLQNIMYKTVLEIGSIPRKCKIYFIVTSAWTLLRPELVNLRWPLDCHFFSFSLDSIWKTKNSFEQT